VEYQQFIVLRRLLRLLVIDCLGPDQKPVPSANCNDGSAPSHGVGPAPRQDLHPMPGEATLGHAQRLVSGCLREWRLSKTPPPNAVQATKTPQWRSSPDGAAGSQPVLVVADHLNAWTYRPLDILAAQGLFAMHAECDSTAGLAPCGCRLRRLQTQQHQTLQT
jgi:hypothetical protein